MRNTRIRNYILYMHVSDLMYNFFRFGGYAVRKHHRFYKISIFQYFQPLLKMAIKSQIRKRTLNY